MIYARINNEQIQTYNNSIGLFDEFGNKKTGEKYFTDEDFIECGWSKVIE